MRVVLPAEHYDRASGALSCAAPALLFLIINAIGSAISPFILLLTAIDFVPIVAFGYGLDLVFRVLPRKLREAGARSPWAAVKVIVSWAIAFPLARTIANFLRGLLEGRVDEGHGHGASQHASWQLRVVGGHGQDDGYRYPEG